MPSSLPITSATPFAAMPFLMVPHTQKLAQNQNMAIVLYRSSSLSTTRSQTRALLVTQEPALSALLSPFFSLLYITQHQLSRHIRTESSAFVKHKRIHCSAVTPTFLPLLQQLPSKVTARLHCVPVTDIWNSHFPSLWISNRLPSRLAGLLPRSVLLLVARSSTSYGRATTSTA